MQLLAPSQRATLAARLLLQLNLDVAGSAREVVLGAYRAADAAGRS